MGFNPNPNLNHLVWEPEDEQFPEVSHEKKWVLIHEGNSKVAVCASFLAAQVPGNAGFKDWTIMIYNSIQKDMRCLVQKGDRCILVGDYDGHIGDDEEGIPGNKESINLNGSLLRTFVKSNHLELINADEELTTGKFTRSAAGNSTILDLAMTTPGD